MVQKRRNGSKCLRNEDMRWKLNDSIIFKNTLNSRNVLRRSSLLETICSRLAADLWYRLRYCYRRIRTLCLQSFRCGRFRRNSAPYNLYFSVFHWVPRSAPPLTDFSLACHKLSTGSWATACRPAAKGSSSGLYLRPGGKWYLITASPGEERGRSRQHGTATNSSTIIAQIKQPLQGQSPPSEHLGSHSKAWTVSKKRKTKTAALVSLCFALIFIWSRLTLSWPQQTLKLSEGGEKGQTSPGRMRRGNS